MEIVLKAVPVLHVKVCRHPIVLVNVKRIAPHQTHNWVTCLECGGIVEMKKLLADLRYELDLNLAEDLLGQDATTLELEQAAESLDEQINPALGRAFYQPWEF